MQSADVTLTCRPGDRILLARLVDCCQVIAGPSCSSTGRIDLSALLPILAEIPGDIPVVARIVTTHAVSSTIAQMLHARQNQGVSEILGSMLSRPVDEEGWLTAMRRGVERCVEQVRDLEHEDLDPRVREALAFTRRHFADPGFRLHRVAERVHTSPWHLQRLIKQHSGRNLLWHLHLARVNEARRLLSRPALSIKEVAAHTGYSCTKQLDRHFVRHFGFTPSVFRKAHRS